MKTFRRIKMVRYALVLFFLVTSLQLMAQGNLREGYVITLQGDTLYGEIDFRTADMNMKRCVFRKNGESSFKTYLPEDISGYRFTSNGIYYISKLVDTKSEGKKNLFVEYVLHGNMNLYQIGGDEMLLEDEEGNQAMFSVEKAQRSVDRKEVRDEMKDALLLLNKSFKATEFLMSKDKNRENTKKAVMTYVDEVCPDGFCEAYEYKNRTAPSEDRTVHPWVKVGFKSTQYKIWESESLSGSSPVFSAGIDFHLNRLLKGFMFNVGLTYESGRAYSSENAYDIINNATEHISGSYNDSIKYNQLDVKLGPGYQFKVGALMLNAKAGFVFRLASHNLDFVHNSYYARPGSYKKAYRQDVNYRFDLQYGLYGCVGVEYPLKKISLTCDLEYSYDYNKWTKFGYPEQTVTKQNGISLSVGVKY
ncbi:MAG: hypothetical protein Q4E68_04650 [Prevotellaceae bacterium]|nr:hypothetical protein [Prevotellaceae bacterium]